MWARATGGGNASVEPLAGTAACPHAAPPRRVIRLAARYEATASDADPIAVVAATDEPAPKPVTIQGKGMSLLDLIQAASRASGVIFHLEPDAVIFPNRYSGIYCSPKPVVAGAQAARSCHGIDRS